MIRDWLAAVALAVVVALVLVIVVAAITGAVHP